MLPKKIFILLSCVSSSLCIANTDVTFAFNSANHFETGGPKPDYVGIADVNNDGHVDMLVSTESKINFLYGDGLGNLEKQDSILLSGKGVGIISADFNGDGIKDLAVSMELYNGYSYWYSPIKTTDIYLGDQNAVSGFSKIDSLTVHGGQNIHAEDFNNDGLDDLLIDRTVLLSLGNGEFNESAALPLSSSQLKYASGAYSADLNNDDFADIVFAGVASFCGDGEGQFEECPQYALSQQAGLVDINDDGLMDIVESEIVSFKQVAYTVRSGGGCGTVVSYSYSGRRGNRFRGGRGRIRYTRCFRGYTYTKYRNEPETSRVVIKIQQNDGAFETIASPIIDGEITAVETLDLNNDQFIDVAAKVKNQAGLTVFWGEGSGNLSNGVLYENVPSILAFEDFDENGYPDIFYVNLSEPTKPDSDAWAFVHLQKTANAPVAPVIDSNEEKQTDQDEPTPVDNQDPIDQTGGDASNFPAIDPEAETLELEGEISAVYADHFIIDGITIWFDGAAIFKYESGHQLAAGETAQVEADPNVDGSGTAIKVQVGPL